MRGRTSRIRERAAAGIAGVDGLVGNVPCAAMNNKRRFHGEENGKGREIVQNRERRPRAFCYMKKSRKEENRAARNSRMGRDLCAARETA